jgi:ubiquitin-conjugating enzyme (huntingtin interacting protein 2)
VIPDSYPFAPVKMRFVTKVYHPNVSSASGAICLDILKDAWTPVLTLKSTLLSLQSLLCSPEPSDPQDAEVAKHFLASRAGFDDTARYWTQIYAGGPEPSSGTTGDGAKPAAAAAATDEIAMAGLERAHVEQFEGLGFPRAKVVRGHPRACVRAALTDGTPPDRRAAPTELSRGERRKHQRGPHRRGAAKVAEATQISISHVSIPSHLVHDLVSREKCRVRARP